ncbi:MAG: hypothetical protein WDA13_00985 [Candidatus Shapirobacteria bacterium]
MNPQQSYKKIEKAATILVYGWVANNVIGTISIIFSIYLIWWKWHLGFLGVLVFIFITWLINGVVLPFVFKIFNKPFAEMARQGEFELAELDVIDDLIIVKLTNTKIEQWPKCIVQNLSEENLIKIFPDYKK